MALSRAELHRRFSSFPDSKHIDSVCRLGEGAAQCRYLTEKITPRDQRYICEKASPVRTSIDETVARGGVLAVGDNCRGVLGFIDDNQKLLVGHDTYRYSVRAEDGRTEREEGVFDALIIEDGLVSIDGMLDVEEEKVEVAIDGGGVTLLAIDPKNTNSNSYEKITVFFE